MEVRPSHTIRGTLLGTTALVSKVLIENPELIQLSLFPRALLGLLALLCGNGFIVGINQIYDVEIDKVNKPYLPIAAGELSLPMAWAFCLATAIGGATIVAMNFGPLITSFVHLWLVLGNNLFSATATIKTIRFVSVYDYCHCERVLVELWRLSRDQSGVALAVCLVPAGFVHHHFRDGIRDCNCRHGRFSRYRWR